MNQLSGTWSKFQLSAPEEEQYMTSSYLYISKGTKRTKWVPEYLKKKSITLKLR